MNLTMSWDLSGMESTLDAISEAAGDLKRPLARIGGYVRSRVEERFEQQGPGWNALAPATVARQMDAAMVSLLMVRKGGKSGIKIALTEQRKIDRTLRTLDNETNATRLKAASKRLLVYEQNAEAMRSAASAGRVKFESFADLIRFAEKEQRRAKIHGAAMRAAQDIPLAPSESVRRYQYRNKKGELRSTTTIDNPSLERRRLRAIGKRRYMAAEHTGRILGNLANSINIRFEGKATVVIYSKARIGKIHNEGGIAGHGAKIPARPFMFLEAADGAVFAEIVQDCFNEAIEAAA